MVRERLALGACLIALALAFTGVFVVPSAAIAKPMPQFHELPSKGKFKIVSFELPTGVPLDRKLIGTAVIRNEGGETDTALIEVRINGSLNSLFDIRIGPGEESIYPIRLSFPKMGTYKIDVKTPHDSRTHEVIVGPAAEDEEAPPAPTPPAPTPGPGGGSATLQLLDIDRNCKLDDSEFFRAIDQWVSAVVTDPLFFSAVDAWIGQSPICVAASALRVSAFRAEMTARSIYFSVRGAGIDAMGVEIFDMAGKPIFAQRASAQQLRWNLLNSKGQQIANGIYLYRLVAYGPDGREEISPMKKIAVIR